MGVSIICNPAPAASSYTNWKLYRATTKTGSYSVINGENGQLLTDLSYYDVDGTSSSWYKVSYYDTDAGTESALSDPFKPLATDYTDVKTVEGFLQLGTTITDSTNPNIQEVVDVIQKMEDRIDNKTSHAWRVRYSGTKSAKATSANYEHYNTDNWYKYQSGIPIYLKHRKIRSFDADEGDAMQYFNGSDWEDWLDTKTEGRADDFWLDYEEGILYVRSRYLVRKPLSMRIKYRYGETEVPGDIQDTCAKMVAIEILGSMDPRSFPVQEGSPMMSHAQRIERYEKDIKDILHNFKEIGMIQSSM